MTLAPRRPAVILLAEDNRGDIFLVQTALAKHQVDHQIHIVTDGEQAIGYLKDSANPESELPAPDLMLLDLNLPRKSGQEVLEQLRTFKPDGAGTTPIIIIMSSSGAPQDRAAIARWNVRAYFTKPSDLDEFMNIGLLVKEALDSANSGKDQLASTL